MQGRVQLGTNSNQPTPDLSKVIAFNYNGVETYVSFNYNSTETLIESES